MTRTWLAVLILWSPAGFAQGDDKKADGGKVEDEFERLAGEWELTSPKPSPLVSSRNFIKRGEWEMRVALPEDKEPRVVRAKLDIDPAKAPKLMDMTTLEDGKPKPGTTTPYIYELDGDTLRLAFGFKAGGGMFRLKQFPKDGAETDGDLHIRVLAYKRVKKK